MIVDVPFFHFACVTMPRCRNAVDAKVAATIPLRIDEVAGAAAPLVATLDTGAAGALQEQYRLHRGGPVRRYGLGQGPQNQTQPVTAANFAALLAGRARGQYGSSPFAAGPRKFDVLIRGRDDVRFWHRDNREVVEATVRKALAAAVFVDGVLHVASKGPAWRIGVNGNRVTITARNEFTGDDPNAEFRGDRYADALTRAQELLDARIRAGQAHQPDDRRVHVSGSIDVLRPEAFTLDDDWLLLTNAAQAFVRDQGAKIWTWPRDAADALLDLRDAQPTWPAALDADALALVHRLRHACRRVRDASTDKLDAALARVGERAPADAATLPPPPGRHS